MYYGDQQAAYTHMRTAFGPYGGAIATGVYGPQGGYAPPPGYQPEGEGGPMAAIRGIGSAIRPVGYMPAPRVYSTPAGQYTMDTGLLKSIGRMTGYSDAPRSMYAYEYRMQAAADAMERASTGLVGGGLMAGALAATPLLAPIGGAAGSVIGSGVGGLAGAPFGSAASLGLGKALGAAGRFAGGVALPLAAAGVASDITDHIAQQRQIRNFLEMSSFRFTGPGSQMADPIMGTGMGMQARRQVADYMTEIDVADPFVDMKDLGRILRTSTELGLMHNTQDIDDFKRRFKSITDNVKLITKTLNTTIEEGLGVMRDLRGIGVTDPGRVGQMVTGAEGLGRVAGRTAQEMITAGMQGAEVYRGTGISMEIGFQATQMNLAAVRSARDAGTLSQEAVAQAGGEEALAQRMTVQGLAFQQSGLGRGVMAAMYGGRGGTLDMGSISRMLGGGIGMENLALQGARRLGNPRSMIEYQANQAKMLSQFGEMFGGQANQLMQLSTAMTEAEYLQRAMPGLDKESAFRYSLQGMGMTEPEIETQLGMIRNADKDLNSKMRSAEATRIRGLTEQSVANMFMTRFYEKFISDPYTSFKQTIAAPINKGIDEMTVSFQKWGRRMMGISTGDISGVEYKQALLDSAIDVATGEQQKLNIIREAREEGGEIAGDAAEAAAPITELEALGTMRFEGPVNLDDYSSMRAKTSEELSKLLENRGAGMRGFMGADVRLQERAAEERAPDLTLNVSAFGGDREGITFEEFDKLRERSKVFTMTQEQADRVAKTGSNAYKLAEERIASGMSNAFVQRDVKEAMATGDVTQAILTMTGKDNLEDVTSAEFAAFRKYFEGDEKMQKAIEKTRASAMTIDAVGNELDTKRLRDAEDSVNEVRELAGIASMDPRTKDKIGETYRPGSQLYNRMLKEAAEDRTAAVAGVVEELGGIMQREGSLSATDRARLSRKITSQSEGKISRLEAERMLDRMMRDKSLMASASNVQQNVAVLQMYRGREAEQQRIQSIIESGDLKEADVSRLTAMSERITKDPIELLSLGKEDIGTLQKAGLTGLVERKRKFEAISKAAGGDFSVDDQMEAERLKDSLKKSYSMSDTAADKFVTLARKEGVDVMLQSLQLQEQASSATETAAAGPGSEYMSEASSAQQRYDLMVRTHQQVYQALSALADRLQGARP